MTHRHDMDAIEARLLQLQRESAAISSTPVESLAPVLELAQQAWRQRHERRAWIPWDHPPSAGLELPTTPRDLDAVCTVLSQSVVDVGLNTTSPRYLGWVPGGGMAAAAAGDYLAALTNAYAGLQEPAPGAVAMEVVLLSWLAEAVGFTGAMATGTEATGWSGDLCSGGSMANTIALNAACPRVTRALGGDRRQHMLAEDLDFPTFLTAQTHGCVRAGLRLIGHAGGLREVGTDTQGRMSLDSLHAALSGLPERDGHRGILVASAGNVHTGGIDPLPQLADIAQEHRLWLHVDGAYGGCFALCADGRARLAGIERADSVVLDPHKGLFQPYGIGAVLIREGRRLYAAHSDRHAYIDEADVPDPSAMHRSPELSRHFRALRLWLSVQVSGTSVFQAALSHRLLLTRWAWERLGDIPGVRRGPLPALSIVCFQVIGCDAHRAVEHLRVAHDHFLTTTTLHGETWIRLVVLGAAVSLDSLGDALLAIAQTAETARS